MINIIFPHDMQMSNKTGSLHIWLSEMINRLPWHFVALCYNLLTCFMFLVSILFLQAFPRGSPLAPEISRGILELASNGTMAELEKELYGDTVCPDKNDSQTSSSLTLHSFLGLFIITGASSLLALILHVGITLYSNRSHLINAHSQGSWRGSLVILSKIFHEHDNSSNSQDKDETVMTNPDPVVESPWSMSNHTIENFDIDTDMGSQEGEGTPGREVSNQDSGPPSFAYMHSDG